MGVPGSGLAAPASGTEPALSYTAVSDPQLDLTQPQRGDSCRTVRALHNPAQVHPEALL